MLSDHEFEEAFKSLERNKIPGHDGSNLNIITPVYELIKRPLLKIFNEKSSLSISRKHDNSKGNTNFLIWQKRITNKLSANFRTFVFLKNFVEKNV